jgi:Fe2+ or Zn2+ uptake regulation protein
LIKILIMVPRMSSSRKRLAPARAEAAARVQAMLERVRSSGLKLTPQRMAIVRELAADPTHPTAQELYERLRPTLPTMSFATVYNTLDALASTGLCAALSLAPGASRFDPNMAAHHHAVCDRCGLVRDVPADAVEAVSAPAVAERPVAALAHAPGFRIRAVERIYRGVCAACVGVEGELRAGAPRSVSAGTARSPGSAGTARTPGRRGSAAKRPSPAGA